MVAVRYYGSIAHYAGLYKEQVRIKGDMNLKTFLTYLSTLKGKEFAERLFHCGDLEGDILIFVNNVDYRLTGGFSTIIKNDDEVVIISYVHPG